MDKLPESQEQILVLQEEINRLRYENRMLRRDAEFFYIFLENTSDYIYIKDRKHRFLFLSQAFARLTRHKHWRELIGKTDYDIFPKDTAELYFEEQRRVIKEGKELIDIEEPYYDLNGKLCWVSTNKKPIFDAQGEIKGLIGISRDITVRKKLEEELKKKAYFDTLTGLVSREMFFAQASKLLKLSKRNNQSSIIIFIDIDDFKSINDNYGHSAGDYVLVTVADRLQNGFRETDIISRFGGDEFVAILPSATHSNLAYLAKKVIDNISNPIYFNGTKLTISCSMGIACFPRHGDNIQELTDRADSAMYEAKRKGKNNFKFLS